ncbi:MAG: squalene--hopene cyclase, partial [Isosphaeraceae bacterium]
MIANKEGGAYARSVDQRVHRIAPRPNPSEAGDLEAVLERTRGWLLSRQAPDGHWVGELEGDTILESELILLLAFLGRESDPICERCAAYLL